MEESLEGGPEVHVIYADNVNEAYAIGLLHLKHTGVREDSRNGPVLVMPTPVTTVTRRPWERVLLDPERRANPFFHLFECLWMLSGSNDGKFLDQFVSDFSSRFGEPEDGRAPGMEIQARIAASHEAQSPVPIIGLQAGGGGVKLDDVH